MKIKLLIIAMLANFFCFGQKTSNCLVCDWNDANTWLPIGVPTATDIVTIRSTDIVYNNMAGLVRTASTYVNGSFQVENGLWVDANATGATNFTYGRAGTLIFNTTSSYGINSNYLFWPYTNGPVNVKVLQGGFTLNSGTSRIITGNLETAAGITIAAGENLVVNGIIQINQNGFFDANSTPTYGLASTLIYNNATAYNVGDEWTGNAITAGRGTPHNVTLTTSSINLPSAARSLTGNLTIDPTSTLNLNGAFAADLNIGGNWDNSGIFNPNNRAVFFRGVAPQTISGQTIFDYLTINNATNVTIGSDITNNLTIDFTDGKLIIGNNDLTIGSGGAIINTSSSKFIVTNGIGFLKRTVSGTAITFPIGPTVTNYNPITVTNSGTPDKYGFRVQSGVVDAAAINYMVNNSWYVSEGTAGGSNIRVVPQWNISDQGSNFNNTDNVIELYSPIITSYPATVFSNAATLTNIGDNFSNNFTGAQYFAVARLRPQEINIEQASTNYLTTSTYSCGNQFLGTSSATITFTIQNLGQMDLTLNSAPKVILSGLNATEFTVNQTFTTTPITSNGTTTFTVTFTPTSLGFKTAALTIANNDSDESSYVINLTGAGTTNPVGYFRSAVGLGSWANASSWESSIDNTSWLSSTISPDNTALEIIIRDTHKIQISTAGVSMSNAKIQNGGILEITTNSSFDLSGDENIELTVEDGGIFLVNAPGNFASPTGNSKALVKTGGKVVAGINMGSGTAFNNAYVGRFNGLFYFGNESICEWLCPSNVLGSSSALDKDFFYPYASGDLPIFRISAAPVSPFGSTYNNVLYAVLEANANFSVQGSGDKTFIGGIKGVAEVTQNTTSGKLILGDGTNVPTIGGSVTLNVISAGLQLPNGANIPMGSDVRIKSSAENNSINRQGGDLIINGTLDITNMRITNTAIGGIVVKGTLKTSNTGGLYGDGSAILGNNLTLNDNSTIEYNATANQFISSAPNYYNIIFSGAETKTTQGPINVDINGFVKITGTTTVDATSNLALTTTNNTAFTMDGGRLILRKGGTQPKMRGNYNLTAGVIEFAETSAKTIRSPKSYQNIEVTGNNVGNSSGNIALNDNGTFIVKTGGIFTINSNAIIGEIGLQSVTVEGGAIFKTGDVHGFNGGTGLTATSIREDIETIILLPNSTVEYSRANVTGDQIITFLSPHYSNLKISGIGIKTLQNPLLTIVNENLNLMSSKLLIKENQAITVNKAVKINGGIVEIENNGQLIQIDELDANENTSNEIDNFKVHRTTQVKNYDYVYWSSPVDGFDVSILPDNNRYYWNPIEVNANGSQGNWLSASGEMERGKGYIARISNASPIDAIPSILVFEGKKPFNGQFTFPISRGTSIGTNDCWNLTGNPYPSAIDADLFLADNPNIEGSVRIWTHGASPAEIGSPFYQDFKYNYSEDDYLIYNATGPSELNTFDGKIASGQGFFIRMLDDEEPFTSVSATSSVTFKNSYRKASDNSILDNSQFYKNSNSKKKIEKSRIWLDLIAPNNQITKTVIGYVPGATLGKDRLYDALIEVESFKLYSLINTQKQAIQGRPVPFDTNDLVLLGMFIEKSGIYTIAISAADGLFSDSVQNIYLEDKLLNTIHDLRKSPYQFTSENGIFDDRFVLRYNDDRLSDKVDFVKVNQVIVTTNDSDINIFSKGDAIGRIQIFDMLGRIVYVKNNLNVMSYTISNMAKNQALIVKVQLQTGHEISSKVIVK